MYYYRKCKVGDYVKITSDEEFKYGHRIPIGTITKIIKVSPYSNSVFPYITQHSQREVRDSEISKITRIRCGGFMWEEKDFKIQNFPTLDMFREEFKDQITSTKEPNAEYGLVDKQGNFYSCEFGGHESLASVLCDYSYDDSLREQYLKSKAHTPLDFLVQDEKWISIGAKGYERITSIVCYEKLNKQQENVILDYIEKFNLKKYPEIICVNFKLA